MCLKLVKVVGINEDSRTYSIIWFWKSKI